MPPKSSSTKQPKDPNAPKKSMSSYMLFANDMRPKMKTSHPELSFGEMAKALGAEWKKVKPDVKQHYEKLAEKGKAKYESDVVYYQKHGGPPAGGYASGSVSSKTATKGASSKSAAKPTSGKTAAATNGKSKKNEPSPVADESGHEEDDDQEDGSGSASGSDEEDEAED